MCLIKYDNERSNLITIHSTKDKIEFQQISILLDTSPRVISCQIVLNNIHITMTELAVIIVAILLKHVCVYVPIVAKLTHVNAVFMMLLLAADNITGIYLYYYCKPYF